MGIAASTGIGAIVGGVQAKQEQQQFLQDAELAAEQTRLSAFTGGPQGQIGAAPATLTQGIVEGGLSGFQFSQDNPSLFADDANGANQSNLQALGAGANPATIPGTPQARQAGLQGPATQGVASLFAR